MKPHELETLLRAFFTHLEIPVSTLSVQPLTLGKVTRLNASITAPEANVLLEGNAEGLKAATSLLRRIAEHQFGEEAAMFNLDINDFWESQVEKIRQQARVAAQRVRLFKTDVALEPMNAYDRLIVHELFSNDADITTESAGEGATRHVVLKYKG